MSVCYSPLTLSLILDRKEHLHYASKVSISLESVLQLVEVVLCWLELKLRLVWLLIMYQFCTAKVTVSFHVL